MSQEQRDDRHQANCARKKRYGNQDTALAATGRYRESLGDKALGDSVYQCRVCTFWHVFSSSKQEGREGYRTPDVVVITKRVGKKR